MFLIKKGTCTVVEDIALHLERKFGHAPKSVADAFVDVWKQTLVIRVVPLFWVSITQFMVRVHVGF